MLGRRKRCIKKKNNRHEALPVNLRLQEEPKNTLGSQTDLDPSLPHVIIPPQEDPTAHRTRCRVGRGGNWHQGLSSGISPVGTYPSRLVGRGRAVWTIIRRSNAWDAQGASHLLQALQGPLPTLPATRRVAWGQGKGERMWSNQSSPPRKHAPSCPPCMPSRPGEKTFTKNK